MDFARKQLEKYGWKEGDGLGKIGNEGIKVAIKPRYKTGKEGMGFDLAKELTDTWWTRSYDASLKAINVEDNGEDSGVKVLRPDDGSAESTDSPAAQMRKRMMKDNFRDFSKGGTLDQGKLIDDSGSSSEDDGPSPPKIKQLTDEELFKACGGRTAHKGARHGLKLSGKLARLAAQDEYLCSQPDQVQLPEKRKKKSKKSKDKNNLI